MDDSGADDDEQGEELGGSEHILDPGGPLDLVAVDEGQDADADGRQQSHGLVRRLTLWILIMSCSDAITEDGSPGKKGLLAYLEKVSATIAWEQGRTIMHSTQSL